MLSKSEQERKDNNDAKLAQVLCPIYMCSNSHPLIPFQMIAAGLIAAPVDDATEDGGEVMKVKAVYGKKKKLPSTKKIDIDVVADEEKEAQ